MFPRPTSLGCERYLSRMISFCDDGDVYCALGAEKSVHRSYLDKYGAKAVEFIKEQVDKLSVPVVN